MSVVSKKGSQRKTVDISVSSEKIPDVPEVLETKEATTKDEKKEVPAVPMIYAVMDSQGACVQFCDTQQAAMYFVARKKFELAMDSLYGVGALKKIEELAQTIKYEIKGVPHNDLMAAVNKLNIR